MSISVYVGPGFSMNKTIFVTGASGFIGSKFLTLALEQGYQIKALCRDKSQRVSHPNLEWIEGNFTNEKDWALHLESVNVVINILGEVNDTNTMRSVNFEAPCRILKAAIEVGVGRWVQLSSVGAYGPVLSGVVSEDMDDRPVGVYEKSKSDFDAVLMGAAQLSDLTACIVRPSIVYGEGMRNNSIRRMLDAIRGGVFAFVGPPGASANYVHVDDVVQAIALCVEHPAAANQKYIVSAWSTIELMVAGLATGAGCAVSKRRIPVRLATLVARIMWWCPLWPLTLDRIRALSTRCRYSTEKIEAELGWELKTSVEEGMRNFARGLS